MAKTTDIADMLAPVECRFCGAVYDTGSVTVTARYQDCSVWQTPCCDRQADDRTWTGFPAIRRIDPSQGDVMRVNSNGEVQQYGYVD